MKHSKNKTNIMPLRVAFAKDWHNEQLCFVFCGAPKHILDDVFHQMRSLYADYHITSSIRMNIVNGKCHRMVVAAITQPLFGLLSEDAWPMMITRLLKKAMPCEVTFYPVYEQFINV